MTEETTSGRSEPWVYVFLVLLIAFNAFIFLGSQDRSQKLTPPVAAGSPVTVPATESASPVAAAWPPGAPGTAGPSSRPPGLAPPPPGSASRTVPPPPSDPGGPSLARTPGEGLAVGSAPAPPPPPPPGPGGKGAPLAGPELLLGLVALEDNPAVRLKEAQEKAILQVLVEMEKPQAAMAQVARKALAFLTPKQVRWMQANRGPVAVAPDRLQPGTDPVVSAVLRALEKRGANASGTPSRHTHESADLHLNDLMNGILKLEDVSGDLALTAAQARALIPLVKEGSEARQEENRLFSRIAGQLDSKQLAFLRENPALTKADVNRMILRYARMAISR